MIRRALAGATLLAALGAAGCYPSNIVASEQRAVTTSPPADLDKLAWKRPTATDLRGFWRSVEIEGDPAVELARIYYVFGAGGRYSGAALVRASPLATFQVLDGRWALIDEGLALDDQPARARISGRWLELSTDEGRVLLMREQID